MKMVISRSHAGFSIKIPENKLPYVAMVDEVWDKAVNAQYPTRNELLKDILIIYGALMPRAEDFFRENADGNHPNVDSIGYNLLCDFVQNKYKLDPYAYFGIPACGQYNHSTRPIDRPNDLNNPTQHPAIYALFDYNWQSRDMLSYLLGMAVIFFSKRETR